MTPDFALVRQELKRPGVILMLLWEEYATGNPLALHPESVSLARACPAGSEQGRANPPGCRALRSAPCG